MPSYVLGLSAFYHDAAACLLADGEIVQAIEEERLSRVKHDHAHPERAIASCLDAAGIGPGDLDLVVFYEKPLRKLERQLDTWIRAFPRSFRSFVGSASRYLDGRVDLAGWLRKKIGARCEVLFSEHHLSHAAFAFHTSPFETAHVLVADGVGEWATTSVWSAGPDGLVAEREIRFPDSLGLFYSLVTAHLGFRVNEDEYKVMGLAAYGEDAFATQMETLLPLSPDGSFRLERRFFDAAGRTSLSTQDLVDLLGPPRREGEPIDRRHQNVARSAQARLEAAMTQLVATLPAGEPLCLSGGVALNGLANARIALGRPVHVPFAPGDSGGAIGAAFVGSQVGRSWSRHPRPSPFLGPSYSSEACMAAASSAGLRVRRLGDMGGDAYVADRLAKGAIVGWLDGRMEFGPRALGRRSILADPRRAEMRDVINDRIKHREPFRPFAPVVPRERVAEYFEVDRPIPWMTEIHPVRAASRAAMAAVVHVDGTARLQTVDRDELPRLHALLGLFGQSTGAPVLLNTSFNVAGEPIVCSPDDACRCLRSAGLDGLVLGDLWVERG
jgi:carbamoyltransferase